MKNKILSAFFLFGIITTIFSCKKDYNCECQKIYTGSGGSTSINDGIYTFKDTKNRAEDKCNKQETSGSDLGGNYSRECQIR